MFSRNELKQQRQRASLNKSTFPTSMCCDKTEYTNPRKYCFAISLICMAL